MPWWLNPYWYWWGFRYPWRGYGYQPFYYYPQPYTGWWSGSPQEERKMLEDHKAALKHELERIEQKLKELEEE